MKQKQKETKTERETATLSAESAQRSQRTAWSMEQVGQPTSSQSQSQCQVATKRTDCPTFPPTVRLSVCLCVRPSERPQSGLKRTARYQS